MQQRPYAFIDDVIGKLPVVGGMWADAFHVWVGVTQAMAMTALRDESLAGPPPARVSAALSTRAAEPLRQAA